MAKFAISTFGRSYLQEEDDELPSLRYVFMLVTAVLGVGTILKFLLHLRTITSLKDKTCNYLPLSKSAKRIVTCYIASYAIHAMHFVDNIWRPVAYYEPEWLYNRYIFCEMEITFFLNFPITLAGLTNMERFVTAVSKRNIPQVTLACKKMTWYIFGSFLTLGHYRVEPPWSYSLSTTFTIAGEGVAGIILAVWLFRFYKTNKKRLNLGGAMDEEGSQVSSKLM